MAGREELAATLVAAAAWKQVWLAVATEASDKLSG